MEVESSAKEPLLLSSDSDLSIPILEGPNSYEDHIPAYNEFTSKDPFSFETILLCGCLHRGSALSSLEFQAFQRLAEDFKIPIDLRNEDQKRFLRGIWNEIFKENEIHDENKFTDEKWKEIGFQNGNPESDFRSGGFQSLRHMKLFVDNNREMLIEMRNNQEKSEFLFAVSSINTSFFLKKYFLMAEPVDYRQGKPIVCSKVIFKSFCENLARKPDQLDKMHDFLLKDLYYTWINRKSCDQRLNIMGFNAVFTEVQRVFHRKIAKLHKKGFEIVEKNYASRLEKLKANHK